MEWEWPEATSLERRTQVPAIAWILYEQGPIESESGRATGMLKAALARHRIEFSQSNLNKVLVEMGEGGRFGPLVARQGEGRRVHRIELTVDPATDPFPPRPSGPTWTKAKPSKVTTDAKVVADEVEAEVEHVASREIVPASSPDPGHDSPSQKLIFASSMIHEVIADLAQQAAASQFEHMGRMFDEQLTAANRLLDEVVRLRDENARLRETNWNLQQAYDALRTSMNGRARV